MIDLDGESTQGEEAIEVGFVEADWPLIGGPFTVRDVLASAPKRLYPRLREEGPITSDQIENLHRQLAEQLPPS